jgi:hypothetical protein
MTRNSYFINNPFSGTTLRLTNSFTTGNTIGFGQAYSTDRVQFDDNFSFSTVFQFKITNLPGSVPDPAGGPDGADGIVFIIQDNSNNPTQTSPSTANLGYNGLPKSAGIKIDTFFNNGIDPANNGNHIGVLGNSGDLRATSFGTPPDYLNNGQIWWMWIDYDGVTDKVDVRVSQTSSRPLNALISAATFNLQSSVGNTNKQAFVGFAAGVGAAASVHEIISWKFRNTLFAYDYPCGKGKYQTTYNGGCTNAPAGYFQDQEASLCYKPCSPGAFSSAGQGSCTQCPANQYSGSAASSCTSNLFLFLFLFLSILYLPY